MIQKNQTWISQWYCIDTGKKIRGHGIHVTHLVIILIFCTLIHIWVIFGLFMILLLPFQLVFSNSFVGESHQRNANKEWGRNEVIENDKVSAILYFIRSYLDLDHCNLPATYNICQCPSGHTLDPRDKIKSACNSSEWYWLGMPLC